MPCVFSILFGQHKKTQRCAVEVQIDPRELRQETRADRVHKVDNGLLASWVEVSEICQRSKSCKKSEVRSGSWEAQEKSDFWKKSPRPLCCIVGSCWIIVQHSENQTTRLRSPSILIQTKFNAQQQRVTHQQASWEESQIVVMIIAVQSVCIYI